MSGPKSPHTSTNPGKRVRLVLRDGSESESRFVERTAKFIVLESGRYRMRDVKQFIVVKTSQETHANEAGGDRQDRPPPAPLRRP